ncbi:hypothetical protein BD324DRAFT_608113 [Kockovaella imperatae]|uniref:Bacterial low temperature requirement A protein-domain-containing protein n=1 Tax=Kockovaella imperatae TaxID=4999 RepID=A0A1Y1UHI1_9TREE|nr:hypothetical protein BD324DRAFT_608113 [Kockovaella imperatae]ORX37520.1 hypothetical protein BD324DRAFT_608113 [Kockovaella imperatae]
MATEAKQSAQRSSIGDREPLPDQTGNSGSPEPIPPKGSRSGSQSRTQSEDSAAQAHTNGEKIGHESSVKHLTDEARDTANPAVGSISEQSRRSSPAPVGHDNFNEKHGASESEHGTADQPDAASVPWLHRPLASKDGPWIRPEHEATEWLSLFYDLAVVAVLQNFSAGHHIGQPEDILTFLSYFVIIYLIWHTQTQYDMRFQGYDIFHLLCKFVQIGIFLYQGAAAGNWDLSNIQTASSAGLTGTDITIEEQGERAFVTVVIAFVVSRVLLAIQYAHVIWMGRKVHRPTAHFWITMGSLFLTIVTAAVAVGIPARSEGAVVAKLVLLYFGIAIEVVEICSAFILPVRPRVPLHALRERYGSFILIILGEGFIPLLSAFNAAISALSGSNTDTYVQAVLGDHHVSTCAHSISCSHRILPVPPIIWQLWERLPNQSRADACLDSATISFGVWPALASVLHCDGGFSTNGTGSVTNDSLVIVKYLNKLQLDTPVFQEFQYLGKLVNNTEPPVDPQIASRQYFAAVLMGTMQSYNVEVDDAVYKPYSELYSLNSTYLTDDAARQTLQDEASTLAQQLLVRSYAVVLPGVLWLLPTAGCVLLLVTCRYSLWTPLPSSRQAPQRLRYVLTVSTQVALGVILGLLGMLAIGPSYAKIYSLEDPFAKLSPLYSSLLNNIPLVIPAAAYFGAWIGPTLALRAVHLLRKRAS